MGIMDVAGFYTSNSMARVLVEQGRQDAFPSTIIRAVSTKWNHPSKLLVIFEERRLQKNREPTIDFRVDFRGLRDPFNE
jgi:hypothetical protein